MYIQYVHTYIDRKMSHPEEVSIVAICFNAFAQKLTILGTFGGKFGPIVKGLFGPILVGTFYDSENGKTSARKLAEGKPRDI